MEWWSQEDSADSGESKGASVAIIWDIDIDE
jgi:hypothetical protein